MNSGNSVELYTALVEDNGINFDRQALPLEDCDKKSIAVGVDCEKGGSVIFSAEIEPLGSYKFILEDRVTGTFTDLGKTTYMVTLPAKTFGTGRFFLHANYSSLTPVTDPTLQTIRIWVSNNTLLIKGEITQGSTCEIYDLSGHKIFEAMLADDYFNSVTVSTRLRGVYIVKIADGQKVITKKVVFP